MTRSSLVTTALMAAALGASLAAGPTAPPPPAAAEPEASGHVPNTRPHAHGVALVIWTKTPVPEPRPDATTWLALTGVLTAGAVAGARRRRHGAAGIGDSFRLS